MLSMGKTARATVLKRRGWTILIHNFIQDAGNMKEGNSLSCGYLEEFLIHPMGAEETEQRK